MSDEAMTATLVRLIEQARIEVMPTAGIEDTVVAGVPRSRTVTITASPARGLAATLELSERLADRGYTVVPHLAARMVEGPDALRQAVARLAAAGITSVFVPGGDADPAGGYHDALGLLDDLAGLEHPFEQIGITGYPESHPKINDDVTVQSMWDKRRHATQIVSNLTFSPALLDSWITRVRARGVELPVLVGVPGPVHRTKLLAIATKVGVGESTRFLLKNRRLFGLLAAPGGFTGERFLLDCAPLLTRPEARVGGLHVYSFNQIAETQEWLERLSQKLTLS